LVSGSGGPGTGGDVSGGGTGGGEMFIGKGGAVKSGTGGVEITGIGRVEARGGLGMTGGSIIEGGTVSFGDGTTRRGYSQLSG
jgi:hypothetical protein